MNIVDKYRLNNGQFNWGELIDHMSAEARKDLLLLLIAKNSLDLQQLYTPALTTVPLPNYGGYVGDHYITDAISNHDYRIPIEDFSTISGTWSTGLNTTISNRE